MPVRLTDFLDYLRSDVNGFDPGDEQYLAALSLLEMIATRGAIPEAPAGWRTVLAPVLCSSPEQQELFYKLFREWLTHPLTPSPPTPPTPLSKHTTVADNSQTSKFLRRLSRGVAALSIVGFCALGSWIYHYKSHQHKLSTNHPATTKNSSQIRQQTDWKTSTPSTRPAPPPRTTVLVRDAKNRPIDGATLYYAGRSAPTNHAGTATLDPGDRGSSRYLLVTKNGYLPTLTQLANGDQEVALLALSRSRDWQSFPSEHPLLLRVFVLFPPCMLALLWIIHLWRRQLELKKWTAPLEERMHSLDISIASDQVFSAAEIRSLATGLRQRRPAESPDLDVPATVESTARNAGYFTPVFARRTSEPDYLFVGERKNLRDHQSRLHDELIFRLRDHDVKVQRYYFQSDPRICTDNRGDPSRLSEIAALFPEHEVWLAIDSGRCIDVTTGLPYKWWSTFECWHDRFLLTFTPPEFALEVRAAPPTRSGIASLIEDGPQKTIRPSQFPSLLRHGSGEWLDMAVPPPALVERLIAQLRLYLAPTGYLLLQACAVYPAIAWNITTRLAGKLLPTQEIEVTLERLVELPWFRHGMMPDWLRVRLVSHLGTREADVRAAIRWYLDTSMVTVSQKQETRDVILGTPKAWRLSGPLKDHVYLSFAQGRRLDRLSVEAPPGWRRFLRDSMALRIAASSVTLCLIWILVGRFIANLNQKSVPLKPGTYAHLLYQVATANESYQTLGGTEAIKINSAIVADVLRKGDPLRAEGDHIVVEGESIVNTMRRPPSPGMLAITSMLPNGYSDRTGHAELVKTVRANQLQFFGWNHTVPRSRVSAILDLAKVTPTPLVRGSGPQNPQRKPLLTASAKGITPRSVSDRAPPPMRAKRKGLPSLLPEELATLPVSAGIDDISEKSASELPPEIELISSAHPEPADEYTIQFKVKELGGGLGRIVCRIDGSELDSASSRVVVSGQTYTLTIAAVAGALTISAHTADGRFEGSPATVQLPRIQQARPEAQAALDQLKSASQTTQPPTGATDAIHRNLDEAGVRQAVERFNQAVNAMNMEQLHGAWLGMSRKQARNYKRLFDNASKIDSRLDVIPNSIKFSGDTAELECQQTIAMTLAGQKSSSSERVRIRLQRTGNGWVVDQVESPQEISHPVK